jgi:hypothetical protein
MILAFFFSPIPFISFLESLIFMTFENICFSNALMIYFSCILDMVGDKPIESEFDMLRYF